MPKQKKKSKSPTGMTVFMLLLVGVLGLTALGYYVTSTPQAQVVQDDLRRPAATEMPAVTDEPTPAPPVEGRSVLLPVLQGEQIVMRPAARPLPSGADPMLFVANETLRTLKIDGARALNVDLQGRTAIVNFNPSIQKGYGSMEEATLLTSLQMGFGQFSRVDQIQLTVNGETVETIGGHMEVDGPLPVIRSKGPVSATPGAGSGQPG
jgi:hypothetical protein